MKYEAEKQLIEMLKKANQGIDAVPDLAKSLIRQYQYQQMFFAIIGVVLLILGCLMFVYWFKNIKNSLFSEKYVDFIGNSEFDLTGFSWGWLFVTAWCIVPGIFMFIIYTANAIAPEIALIEKLLSK